MLKTRWTLNTTIERGCFPWWSSMTVPVVAKPPSSSERGVSSLILLPRGGWWKGEQGFAWLEPVDGTGLGRCRPGRMKKGKYWAMSGVTPSRMLILKAGWLALLILYWIMTRFVDSWKRKNQHPGRCHTMWSTKWVYRTECRFDGYTHINKWWHSRLKKQHMVRRDIRTKSTNLLIYKMGQPSRL